MGLGTCLFICVHVFVWCVDKGLTYVLTDIRMIFDVKSSGFCVSVGMTFLVGIPNYKATLTFSFTKGSVYTDTQMQTNTPTHTRHSAQIHAVVSFLFYSSVLKRRTRAPVALQHDEMSKRAHTHSPSLVAHWDCVKIAAVLRYHGNAHAVWAVGVWWSIPWSFVTAWNILTNHWRSWTHLIILLEWAIWAACLDVKPLSLYFCIIQYIFSLS